MKIADIGSAIRTCLSGCGALPLNRREPGIVRALRTVVRMFLLLAAVTFSIPSVLAQDARCARIDARQGYGPFDYRQRYKILGGQAMRLVEGAHFQDFIQRNSLRGDPKRGTRINLDYTLRAFPNHAPALYLLAVFDREFQRFNPDKFRRVEKGREYSPVMCYFERAVRFAPDDPNVHNAYGRFLTSVGKHDSAIEAFQRAVKIASKSASAHYNLGLAFYVAGKFEDSAKAAKEAYRLGYKRPELRDRLKRKGVW